MPCRCVKSDFFCLKTIAAIEENTSSIVRNSKHVSKRLHREAYPKTSEPCQVLVDLKQHPLQLD